MPVMYLLMNFALADAKICYILLIVLFSHFNRLVVVVSKLVCKKSNVTIIAILSQISSFGVITNYKYSIKKSIFIKMLLNSLSNLFSLLISD